MFLSETWRQCFFPQLFSLRFEAAKIIEEEHDAELEERDRQNQELAVRAATSDSAAVNESGEWLECDSGIQWVAIGTVASDDIVSGGKTKTSVVSGLSDDCGSSAAGDFQILTGSQGDDENFTKGTNALWILSHRLIGSEEPARGLMWSMFNPLDA